MPRIFFDHISTTPLDPRAFEAMRPYLFETYGNPSSHIHDQGQAALRAVANEYPQRNHYTGISPQFQSVVGDSCFSLPFSWADGHGYRPFRHGKPLGGWYLYYP